MKARGHGGRRRAPPPPDMLLGASGGGVANAYISCRHAGVAPGLGACFFDSFAWQRAAMPLGLNGARRGHFYLSLNI